MTGKEENIKFDGFTFKYILKNRSYDTNHLIVVFSGFGGKSVFNYDFLKALQSNRAYVLWIKDDFFDNGLATFYLDPIAQSEKKLEKAIIKFLYKILAYLNLNKENCTLLGCSKGGAGALFYGIKYNFTNILVSAPTILVGSSVASKKSTESRKNAEFMLGKDVDRLSVQKIDSLIVDNLNNDTELDKNIYLLSSKADRRHTKQVEPFISTFIKYNNFNYIESTSVLVRKHQDVTTHNAPLILGILNTLAFNLKPFFTKNVAYGDAYDKVAEITKDPVLDIKILNLDTDGSLYIEGVYFLRGLSCSNYSDLSYTLKFNSYENSYEIGLDKDNKPIITKSYYKDAFVNYDKAYFCSKEYKGINTSNIKPGTYRLSISILMYTTEYSHENSLVSVEPKYNVTEGGKFTHIIYSFGEELYYSKIKSLDITKEPVFELKRLDFDISVSEVLYLEGVYFLRGLACANYSDLNYSLKMKSKNNSYRINIAKGKKASITKSYYKNSLINYDKAYFCTKGYNGIDISHIEPGIYQLFIEIVMHTGDNYEIEISSSRIISQINKNDSYSYSLFSDTKGTTYRKEVSIL